MDWQAEVTAGLRRTKQKVTSQRVLVLTSLCEMEGHVTPSQIIDAVAQRNDRVDPSTVYRVLWQAEEAGLVVRFSRPGCEVEFEWLDAGHHHLVCRTCGNIDTLDEEAADTLRRSLLESKGFVADLRHIAVEGICRSCREKDLNRVLAKL